MSATFKNNKRKLSQNDLRRLMSEHKEKVQKIVKKIESPLAKYNDSGQLTCILCQSVVKSEAVWTVHINSKQHKDNIEKAKKLKEKTNNFTTSVKRSASSILPEDPPKKLKGILKNSQSAQEPIQSETAETVENNLSISLSVNNPKSDTKISDSNTTPGDSGKNGESALEAPIPEGFFDDPKQDAKIRNVEYKDPIEEEWERFQKEIREAGDESAVIISEDQDEATNERQLDEIEEQMRNWSRVLSLEKKKTEVVTHLKLENSVENMEDDTDLDIDVDEIFDWRSKKSF